MNKRESLDRLRASVIDAWPQAADWDDGLWRRWAHELRGFTDDELQGAVRQIARSGRILPPGWGMIYRAASGPRAARISREAERRWMEDDDAA